MAELSSSSRTGEYTQVHKCRMCGRVFWSKSSWNGVSRLFTVRGECSAVMGVHAAVLAALRNRIRVL